MTHVFVTRRYIRSLRGMCTSTYFCQRSGDYGMVSHSSSTFKRVASRSSLGALMFIFVMILWQYIALSPTATLLYVCASNLVTLLYSTDCCRHGRHRKKTPNQHNKCPTRCTPRPPARSRTLHTQGERFSPPTHATVRVPLFLLG